MLLRVLGCIAVSLVFSACGPREMVVESDTYWSGAIGNSSRDGFGRETMKITGSGTWCWSIQKQTRGGYLKAYARVPGIFGPEEYGHAETNAQFGVVTGCSP